MVQLVCTLARPLFMGTAVIEADKTARSLAQTNSHSHGSARPRTGGQFRFRDLIMSYLQSP
ncbi:hypothetical protein LB504_005320 [Fusarium proliferatum]|nr:hypothetical protein LB504_005320 [Fusarium proliferatum]